MAASLSDVWDAWTTTEGAQRFFGPMSRIDMQPGGAYEIELDTSRPEGQRGSEGCRVLSFLHHEMLSFTWNAPPWFPAVRESKTPTWVVIHLHPAGAETRVVFTHAGWREGDEWDEVYAYFTQAWEWVLDRLQQRFSGGDVEW